MIAVDCAFCGGMLTVRLEMPNGVKRSLSVLKDFVCLTLTQGTIPRFYFSNR